MLKFNEFCGIPQQLNETLAYGYKDDYLPLIINSLGALTEDDVDYVGYEIFKSYFEDTADFDPEDYYFLVDDVLYLLELLKDSSEVYAEIFALILSIRNQDTYDENDEQVDADVDQDDSVVYTDTDALAMNEKVSRAFRSNQFNRKKAKKMGVGAMTASQLIANKSKNRAERISSGEARYQKLYGKRNKIALKAKAKAYHRAESKGLHHKKIRKGAKIR